MVVLMAVRREDGRNKLMRVRGEEKASFGSMPFPPLLEF